MAKFGRSFRRPIQPGVYDKKLKGDKVTAEIRKAEAAFDSVEDVWLAELWKKCTIYAESTALELIEHLYKDVSRHT